MKPFDVLTPLAPCYLLIAFCFACGPGEPDDPALLAPEKVKIRRAYQFLNDVSRVSSQVAPNKCPKQEWAIANNETRQLKIFLLHQIDELLSENKSEESEYHDLEFYFNRHNLAPLHNIRWLDQASGTIQKAQKIEESGYVGVVRFEQYHKPVVLALGFFGGTVSGRVSIVSLQKMKVLCSTNFSAENSEEVLIVRNNKDKQQQALVSNLSLTTKNAVQEALSHLSSDFTPDL